MTTNYLPITQQRLARVAELTAEGFSTTEIAQRMGVSPPRVSQLRRLIPHIDRIAPPAPRPSKRLTSHREQLIRLRREVVMLALVIREDLRLLNEELESADVDALLGLRPSLPP